jgi:hypothetical protein
VDDTRARQLIRCEWGLDRQLAEFASPAVDLRALVRAAAASQSN